MAAREVMAAHDYWKSTDLVPLLAERGVELSASQVFRERYRSSTRWRRYRPLRWCRSRAFLRGMIEAG